MNTKSVRVARLAMGTRFEILLCGEDEPTLRAAGEEALDEIERLERQLSLFRSDSEISRINRQAAQGPVRVEPRLFELLEACRKLWKLSEGAFDVTVGPLMHCWGFRGERPEAPSPDEVAAVRERVGMQHVVLDPEQRTVFFEREGVALDLGAIAKGWALDEAALLIREGGVENALLHGGTSTACAIGHAPQEGSDGWTIAISPPPPEVLPDGQSWPEEYVRSLLLHDESLSVSGIGGRFLRRGDRIDAHVLDPRIGRPVQEAFLAAVVLPSATESDAFSTALLVGGTALQERLGKTVPNFRSLLLARSTKGNNPLHLATHGL